MAQNESDQALREYIDLRIKECNDHGMSMAETNALTGLLERKKRALTPYNQARYEKFRDWAWWRIRELRQEREEEAQEKEDTMLLIMQMRQDEEDALKTLEADDGKRG